MYPVIKPYDLFIIDIKPNITIENGDIITFRGKAIYYPLAMSGEITHRVIYKNSKYIKTKGDNVSRPDPPIERSQVIGRVVAIIHRENRNKFVCEPLFHEKSEVLNEFFMLNQLKSTGHVSYPIKVVIFMLMGIFINLFIVFI